MTAGIGLELTAFPSVAVRDVIFGGLAGFIAESTQALLLARRRSR